MLYNIDIVYYSYIVYEYIYDFNRYFQFIGKEM